MTGVAIAPERRATRIGRFYGSTIGKKVVMAATGLIMVAFLISHVLSNLLVFRGPEQLNGYAALLREFGGLLWLARAGLLAAVVLHIVAAVDLTRRARAARPSAYAKRDPQVSTLASRTIRWGGALLAVFILFHILHFTTGTIRPTPFVAGDVYSNVIGSFRVPWVVLLYVIAMLALGLHLYHGTWSAFRTLGLVRPSGSPLRRRLTGALALALWAGFTVIPIAVLVGLVR